jgi:hypothetical protein
VTLSACARKWLELASKSAGGDLAARPATRNTTKSVSRPIRRTGAWSRRPAARAYDRCEVEPVEAALRIDYGMPGTRRVRPSLDA